jgi:predicted nucleic acid-binding protein
VALYVLDTSAIMAALRGEAEYEKVEELLRVAQETGEHEVLLPFIALMEVEYRLLRDMNPDEVAGWMNIVLNWPVELRESDFEWGREAARVKSGGGLSLADSWIAALALQMNATLVHKDPEFETVRDLVDLRLRYDKDGL